MALETYPCQDHGWSLSAPAPLARVTGAIRYAGVLGVWLGLLLIRPRLALDIFRHRRANSPIPRLGVLFRAA